MNVFRDGISRQWRTRKFVRRVRLMIFDEIHMLGIKFAHLSIIISGTGRGPIVEVIVSRMRRMSHELNVPIRFVGLSTALANAKDIGDWLGVGKIIQN